MESNFILMSILTYTSRHNICSQQPYPFRPFLDGFPLITNLHAINNNFNHMDDFQSSFNLILKSLLRMGQLQVNLYQLSNLKIINYQQLYQNPYIADELALARNQLRPIKEEIQTTSEQVKQAIDCLSTLQLQQTQQHKAILSRVITRIIDAVSASVCEQEVEYYKYQDQRFRAKCTRILEELQHWEAFEVVRVLYKYFRHVVLIELQRYEEILECMTQTDFQSIKFFREYFYNLLQKKESKRREMKYKETHTPRQTHNNQQEVIHTNTLPNSSPAMLQSLQNIQNNHHQQHQLQQRAQTSISNIPSKHSIASKEDIFETFQNEPCQIQAETPPALPSPTKGKLNTKSTKKLFSLVSSVMDVKKDHLLSDPHTRYWEQKSLYSDLIGRNKPNHHQISVYYHYSQLMALHLSQTDPSQFYYYKEEPLTEPIQEEKAATEKKHLKVVIPANHRESIFTNQIKRKEPPLLINPLEKRKETRTIHKSIDCKPKIQTLNAQSKEYVQQRPLKIDSDFLQISLRKIIPTRRQTQMQQMITRASSLGIIRHDLHHKRIQVATQNALKADHDVFKSVRILHQGQYNSKREAEVLKVIKQKKLADLHHDRIQNRIKVELKQAQQFDAKAQDVKKRMAFKKIEL